MLLTGVLFGSIVSGGGLQLYFVSSFFLSSGTALRGFFFAGCLLGGKLVDFVPMGNYFLVRFGGRRFLDVGSCFFFGSLLN